MLRFMIPNNNLDCIAISILSYMFNNRLFTVRNSLKSITLIGSVCMCINVKIPTILCNKFIGNSNELLCCEESLYKDNQQLYKHLKFMIITAIYIGYVKVFWFLFLKHSGINVNSSHNLRE